MAWTEWVLPAAFTAISFAVGLVACALVKRTGVVDAPDEARKMQSSPVPRLGGVAILIGALVGMSLSFLILILAYRADPIPTISSLITGLVQSGGGLGLAFVFVAFSFLLGLWDDLWKANTKLKLTGLLVCALVLAGFGLRAAALTSPWGDVSMPVILIIGSAAWLLVMTNAANFMDGSNGLAVGSLAIMIVGLAVIGGTSGTWEISIWWFPLFGSIAAFLVHNLRGALFVGDAGALGLGALFAALSLASGLEVWTVATLALPFLMDVLLTLIWRAKHGRNWLEAHLDHAYQRLIASGWSHIEAAFLYWGLSATAASMAYIAAQAGGAAPFAVFWTLALAPIGIWILHRRTAQRDDLVS